jgi:hypothetical protein
MTLTVHADLRAAFREALLTIKGLPDQHWEARRYQPTKGTAYVSEQFRPISSVVRATGIGGTIAHTCTANFTLHYPADEGTLSIDVMAAKIMDKFSPGSSLAYGASTAVVIQAERAPLVQEPDWINCAVIITVVAYTSR